MEACFIHDVYYGEHGTASGISRVRGVQNISICR